MTEKKHEIASKMISKEELMKRYRIRWAKEHPGQNLDDNIKKTRESIDTHLNNRKAEKVTPEMMSAYQRRTGRGYNE